MSVWGRILSLVSRPQPDPLPRMPQNGPVQVGSGGSGRRRSSRMRTLRTQLTCPGAEHANPLQPLLHQLRRAPCPQVGRARLPSLRVPWYGGTHPRASLPHVPKG